MELEPPPGGMCPRESGHRKLQELPFVPTWCCDMWDQGENSPPLLIGAIQEQLVPKFCDKGASTEGPTDSTGHTEGSRGLLEAADGEDPVETLLQMSPLSPGPSGRGGTRVFVTGTDASSWVPAVTLLVYLCQGQDE